jgi:hypothetical protein
MRVDKPLKKTTSIVAIAVKIISLTIDTVHLHSWRLEYVEPWQLAAVAVAQLF